MNDSCTNFYEKQLIVKRHTDTGTVLWPFYAFSSEIGFKTFIQAKALTTRGNVMALSGDSLAV